MAKNDFEFMEALDVPTNAEFEDHLRLLEDEAHDIYVAQYERSEISAEECEALYHSWVVKYRHSFKRPELRLPGAIGSVLAVPSNGAEVPVYGS